MDSSQQIKCLLFLIVTFNVVSGKVHCDNSKIERNNIEYYRSSGLNLILAAPHGGWREPDDIPDRDFGCANEEHNECVWEHDCGDKNPLRCRAVSELDFNTYELAVAVRRNLCHMFGGSCPAVVTNLLNRKKFDANRNLSEATFNVEKAVEAFYTFHEFIDMEKEKIHPEVGGLFVDIHGQNHPIARAELGYLLKREDFDKDLRISLPNSSIRSLAMKFCNDTEMLEAILRGNKSLGWFLQENGFAAVPSPTYQNPGNDPYFTGGYNTLRHGSLHGGSVDGIQIESTRSVRDDDRISEYSCGLSRALKDFLCTNYYSISDHESISDAIRQSCYVSSSETDCVNISF